MAAQIPLTCHFPVMDTQVVRVRGLELAWCVQGLVHVHRHTEGRCMPTLLLLAIGNTNTWRLCFLLTLSSNINGCLL